MTKVVCKHLSLSEICGDVDLSSYKDFVSPFSYEFALDRGAEYLMVAIVERKGGAWLYVASADDGIYIVPAALFSFDDSSILSGMVVRMTCTPQPSLEILPASLSRIDGWFERYVGGDQWVIGVVESEIGALRKKG